MYKLIDQTSDINGQQLYRLSKLYQLPPFVKKAASIEIYGVDDLQMHQYADPSTRQFPCHTPAATYVSTLFFLDKQAELDTDKSKFISARLDDFAFYHGIDDDIKSLKTKLASDDINSDYVADEDYALILSDSEKYYPLRNALEVKKAAEFLLEHKAEIPFEYRTKIASKILEKANQYGASLGDLDYHLNKQAGYGGCSSTDAAMLLFDRARLLKQAGKIDYAIRIGEIAKTVAGNAHTVHDSNQLIKLACLIDEVDKTTGLNRMIEDLVAPEDIFFSLNEKIAEDIKSQHFKSPSGDIYKVADMNKLKLDDVRSMLGTEFADAVSVGGLFLSAEKLAEIVPTLPRGDAELFDRLVQSVGISPTAKEAAHEKVGFTNEELFALATLHNSK